MNTPHQVENPGPFRKKYVRTRLNEDVSEYMKKRARKCQEENQNFADIEQVSLMSSTIKLL